MEDTTLSDIQSLHAMGWSWSRIAAHYRVPERTVRRWDLDPSSLPERVSVSAPLELHWGKALIVSDTQFPYIDRAAWDATCELAEDAEVDTLLWDGDMLDFPQLSSYKHNPYKLPTARTDIDDFHDQVRTPLVTSLALRRERWVNGNHEFRATRYFDHNAGAMGDPPDPREFLQLPDHVEFTEYGKLSGTMLTPKLLVAHGWQARKHSAYTAKANAEDIGISSVITGHTHRTGWYSHTTPSGVQGAWEIGHMCDPTDLPKAVEGYQNWQQVIGTLVSYERGGDAFHVEIVPIIGSNNDRAVCHMTNREYRVQR